MPELEFAVLGSVEVRRAGRPVALGGNRVLTLLAGLLLSPNHIVSVERLTEWVWGERPPRHPRSALHNSMSRVRGLLGAGVIETQRSGYRLRTDAGHLDLLLFDELTVAAVGASRDGSSERSVELLDRALGLWQLPLLSNIDAPALHQHATGALTDRYLDAHEHRARESLRLGRHDAVVSELTGLVRTHPFRETLASHLMMALFCCGRRADALLVYQKLRRALREELGVDPAVTVQDLYIKILRSDPALRNAGPVAGRSTRGVLVGARPDAPHQLPGAPAGFVGREPTLAELDGWVDEDGPRLAALVGPAGVGKTALAVHWADRLRERFPDGELYLDLRGYHRHAPLEAGTALAALLRSCGLGQLEVPAAESDRAAMLRTLLARRRMLLVLDNARDTEQVLPLLGGPRPGSVILVTSRNQLRGLVALAGARRFVVPGLDVAAVRTMLADVTQWPDARLPTMTVAALTRRLSGLPIALRLLGERVARDGTDLSVVADRSTPLLDEMDARDGDGSDLRTVLSWSVRALGAGTGPAYAELGRRVAARFGAAEAAAVLGMAVPGARRLLDRLASVHLVRQIATDRYEFDELLRAYAREGDHLVHDG